MWEKMQRSELWKEIEAIDIATYGCRHWEDYGIRRCTIIEKMYAEYGIKKFTDLLQKMYVDEQRGCNEIAEVIKEKTGETITARSIERAMRKAGVTIRHIEEAYKLAIKRGRVTWAYKELKKKKQRTQISSKTRFEVFKRDGNKCKLCGATAEKTNLEIDHIIARINGGGNEISNLRVLCHECNMGKSLAENERETVGGFRSGKK